MSGRKKLSGAEYRKRKAEKEKSLSKQEGSLQKYIFQEKNVSSEKQKEKSDAS